MTGFVGEHFGVTLRGHGGEPLGELVQLALRRNPKRAHLLVSTVLGKHVPVDPRSRARDRAAAGTRGCRPPRASRPRS